MITVRTTDGQVFRFPEGMSQEEMSAAIQRHYQRGQQQPQQSQAEPDRSFGSAFSYALDAPLENMAQTANVLGAQGVGQFLSNLTEAPENYQSASAEFMNEGGAGYKLSALPRAAVEQAGQFAGSVASRGVGAFLGGAAGSVIPGAGTLGGAGVGAFLGPALFEGIQILGPVAQERARNDGRETPNAEDFLFAASTATGSGALNAIAPGLSGIFKRVLAEGGTEALQSAIQQTGETVATDAGLQISPKEAIGEGIIGGTSAGGVTAITNTVDAAGNVVLRKPEELSPEVRQAAADVARDLQETAQENNLNLADIERASTRGADQALDNVRAKYRAEIKGNNKVLLKEIGERLNESEKAQLAELIRQAGTKVGEAAPAATPKGSIEFVLNKFGDTTEGQALANAIHKSNVVTELYASGLHGGVSQFTDLFNPLNVVQRSYDPGRVIRGGLSGYTALSTSGASIPIQMGIVGAGRAIDAMTGRRSKVRKFIQNNRKQDGLATPMGVTVEGRKARLRAEAKARAEADKEAQRRAQAERERVAAEIKQAEAQRAAERKLQLEMAKQQPKPLTPKQRIDAVKKQAAERKKAEQEAAARDLDQRKAANNRTIYLEGDAPVTDSPRGVMFQAIFEASPELQTAYNQGRLTPANLDRIIELALARGVELAKTEGRAIPRQQYLDHLKTGMSDKDGYLNVATRTAKNGLAGIDTKPFIAPKDDTTSKPKDDYSDLSRRERRGLEANRREIDRLIAEVEASNASASDKAVLIKHLELFKENLGASRVERGERILASAKSELSDPGLADVFISPYVELLRGQKTLSDDRVVKRRAKANSARKKSKAKDKTPVKRAKANKRT